MIKIIIFDFDCTMYVGNNGDSKAYDKAIVDLACGVGAYDKLSNKYGIYKKDIKEFVDAARAEGLNFRAIAKEFSDRPFIHKIKDKLEILPNEFFQKLSKNHRLYVASMSQINYLQHYFDLYDIDKSCFQDFLCMDLVKHSCKKDLFRLVMQKENCKANEILMIGDNLVHDIQPALELGMNALHFEGDFNQIYDYLSDNQICDCKEFKAKKKFIYKQ